MLRMLLSALALTLMCGCLFEPSVFCDDTRIGWGFDNHEISTADDVSEAPGLQIDVVVLTALPEGKPATLTVIGEDEVENVHPGLARVGADGRIVFEEVEVPTGTVLFNLRSENDCREVESNNRRFVIDEGGPSVCELEFMPPTRPIAGHVPLRSYIRDDDQDPVLPQTQVDLRVFTSRAQMAIRLLLLNVDTQTPTIAERTTDETGSTTFNVSFGQGEVAIRALCTGGLNETAQSSATFPVLVDTIDPDCDLIEPSGRVVPADDIDGALAGIQIVAIAQTSDASSLGLEAGFSVNGADLEIGTIGPAGQSTAIITVPIGGGAQDFQVTLPDLAGNTCTAIASF